LQDSAKSINTIITAFYRKVKVHLGQSSEGASCGDVGVRQLRDAENTCLARFLSKTQLPTNANYNFKQIMSGTAKPSLSLID